MAIFTRERDLLAAHVLRRTRVHGHAIPRIVWDRDGAGGAGTCARCGDGVMIHLGRDGWSIGGTAYDYDCPGDTCDHGWRVVTGKDGLTVLECLHCGAIRTEGPVDGGWADRGRH